MGLPPHYPLLLALTKTLCGKDPNTVQSEGKKPCIHDVPIMMGHEKIPENQE